EPIMNIYTKRSILFLLIAALLLVACGGSESETSEDRDTTSPIAIEGNNETSQEEADNDYVETITSEGEPVEVTRIVTETVIVEAEGATEESMDTAADYEAPPAPLATAPPSGTTPEEPPL